MRGSTTFKDHVNSLIRHLRKQQICGLVLILSTFFFVPLIQYAAFGTFLGVVIMLRTYYIIRTELKCPKCSASLSFLVIDPNYAGTPGAIILPREFPSKVKYCPSCGFSFSEIGDS